MKAHKLFQDNQIQVSYIFGVQDYLSDPDNKVSRWNSSYQGQLVLEPSFDITKEETQTDIMNLCRDLLVSGQAYVDPVTNMTSLSCFMWDFKNYVEDNLGQKFPVPQKQFQKVFLQWIIEDQKG